MPIKSSFTQQKIISGSMITNCMCIGNFWVIKPRHKALNQRQLGSDINSGSACEWPVHKNHLYVWRKGAENLIIV